MKGGGGLLVVGYVNRVVYISRLDHDFTSGLEEDATIK